MALYRIEDDDFFANPFRALLDPRVSAQSFATAPSASAHSPSSPITVDVLERDDKYIVKANVPGIAKEKLNLSLDGDLMTLSVDDATQKEKDESLHGCKVHRLERTSTYLRRVIRLPDSADIEKISANMSNGVLEVDVPKKQASNQRKRQITVGGEKVQPGNVTTQQLEKAAFGQK